MLTVAAAVETRRLPDAVTDGGGGADMRRASNRRIETAGSLTDHDLDTPDPADLDGGLPSPMNFTALETVVGFAGSQGLLEGAHSFRVKSAGARLEVEWFRQRRGWVGSTG